MDDFPTSMRRMVHAPARMARLSRMLALVVLTVLTFAGQTARANAAAAPAAAPTQAAGGPASSAIDALQAGMASQIKQLALDGSRRVHADVKRIEVSLGQLDPRLRLAPCQRIEPYLPAGTVPWGKTRIGLRCTQGASAWKVFLPITVSVFGKAWVAAAPLSAGSVVSGSDLIQAEVNLAEDASMAVTDSTHAVGRTLARALNAGQVLRQSDMKVRQWFAAGDEVMVSARGNGFSVASVGQALTHGLEGQPVRVRVESGRVVVGTPVGERLVELPL